MPKGRFNILLFAVLSLTIFSCSKFDKIQRSDNLEEKLKAAFDYYEKKDYHKASVLFEELVPLLRGRSESEKASFYQANCHFHQKQYIMSSYYYRDFIETFPRSEYTEDARFYYAKSLYKDSPRSNLDQTNTTSALKAIQTFANRHPNSDYMEEINRMADELNKKLEVKAYENAKIFYKLGSYNSINYKSAVVAFTSFLYNYPESKYAEELTYLRIDAQYQLAKSSILTLQKERYYDAIEYYEYFIDKYEVSRYRKSAESIFESIRDRISKKEEAEASKRETIN